jgi:anti-anti-sigma factor
MRVERQTTTDGDGEKSVTLAVVGEVDADNCVEFRSALNAAAGTDPVVVVELSELGFLDSSGISQLLRFKTELADAGRVMTVENPSAPVRRVLEITGLLDHFGLGD